MAIQRLPIASFLAQSAGGIVLDVRSPAEYQHAHMPGAISFPLFSDEERKVVGTLYKQQSREEAIKAGLDLFGPRMRTMVEAAETLVKERISDGGARDFYLYCWRGGMRSAAVAWLLDLYGFRVFVLAGGYKTYRQHVLQSFEKPYQFSVVGGYIGSGKTEVLNELQKLGENIINL